MTSVIFFAILSLPSGKEKQKLKKNKTEFFKHSAYVLLGCLIVALANALFLVPFDIVKGGMTSLAMMISELSHTALTDLWLWVLNGICWLLALVLLGKKYAFLSLMGTALYPLFMTLFQRTNLVEHIGLYRYYGDGDTAKLILLGLAGGVLNGLGLSLCLIGKSSTGGSDVLSAIASKYLSLKRENAALLIDAAIIFLGFLVYKDWGKMLVGILTAITSSVSLRLVYGKTNTVYVLDILTDHVEELRKIIQEDLKETSTIYTVVGSYSQKEKKVVHCLLLYKEAKELKAIVRKIDPHAFLTVYEATSAFGGSTFDAYLRKKERKKIENMMKEKKEED